jgi:glycosyltransferase involved in cell wall biosynthesis
MGVPVVSCHISGIPELIADGRTGFLAEPGDADSLAQAVLRCARAFTGDGASEGRELVNRARAQIEAHFNVQSAARYLARLFHCERDLIASTEASAAFGAEAGICRG